MRPMIQWLLKRCAKSRSAWSSSPTVRKRRSQRSCSFRVRMKRSTQPLPSGWRTKEGLVPLPSKVCTAEQTWKDAPMPRPPQYRIHAAKNLADVNLGGRGDGSPPTGADGRSRGPRLHQRQRHRHQRSRRTAGEASTEAGCLLNDTRPNLREAHRDPPRRRCHRH